MKIALVGTTAATLISFRADMIQALVFAGNQVFAFATDYSETTREAVRRLGAVPVDYEFDRTGINPWRDLLNTLKLTRQFRRNDFHMVFSYFAKPVIFATLAAKLAGIPRRVGMLEGLGHVFTDFAGGPKFKQRILRKIQVVLYRIAFPFLEHLIFLNKDDPVDLLEKHALIVRRVSILGGIGLNLARYPYSGPRADPIRFIYVGRLLEEKGVREYIAAATIVKKQYPAVEFVLLGALDVGTQGCMTQGYLDALIRDRVVVYPGFVDDVSTWLASSSVFVLPSYREGCPRSTQEAMAIGRAVISTDVPGCRDTVIDGENGFLVPPWDAAALASRMKFFIEHPEQIVTMGLVSHEMAKTKFDANLVNRKLLNLLDL